MTLQLGTPTQAPWSEPDVRWDRIMRVLHQHQRGTDGWCEGCARAGILTFHPCPSASWAHHAAQEVRQLASAPLGGYH
jgi:hypothetical protein